MWVSFCILAAISMVPPSNQVSMLVPSGFQAKGGLGHGVGVRRTKEERGRNRWCTTERVGTRGRGST